MAVDITHPPVRVIDDECKAELEAQEHKHARKMELLGMAVLIVLIIYMLSLQASLGNVGIAINFIAITLLGKVGAYVIPLGLVTLASSFLLARKNKGLDGAWKFFLIAAPAASCVVDILLHSRMVYIEDSARLNVGVLGIWLSRFFRAAFGPVGSVWIIVALLFLLFLALTGFSIFSSFRWFKGKVVNYRKKSKIRKISEQVKEAADEIIEGPIHEIQPVIQPEPLIEAISDAAQMAIEFEVPQGKDGKPSDKRRRRRRKYQLPPLNLLRPSPKQENGSNEQREAAECVIKTLETYGIQAELLDIIRGPRVTRVEVGIGIGTRLYKVEALAEEIAYALPAKTVRIEAPIPDKQAIGIEFPNRTPVVVTLREMLATDKFRKNPKLLYMAIAKDLGGDPVYATLSDMPHLLIAGATGTGKSVCLNACIVSLLYRATPDEVRMILIDPKMVEMAAYEGLPHLLTEVVNDIQDALNALRWAVEEMRNRFKLLKKAAVNNVADYNKKVADGDEKMPYIVIIVDEMADLMAAEPIEMEKLIAALTRLARAVGIHLILATQRPDVKVITGGIKANIPARIAFKLPSQHDSRTVLNAKGAEKLLANGDMLYHPIEESKPIRAQGALVVREEIERVVAFWKAQGMPEYDEEILADREPEKGRVEGKSVGNLSPEDQALFDKAIRIAWTEGEVSASLLQRKLGIGWPKAGRFMEFFEELNLVGSKCGTKPRKITFDESHPALKLFEADDYLPPRHGKRARDEEYEDDDYSFLPAVESLDGKADEILGI